MIEFGTAVMIVGYGSKTMDDKRLFSLTSSDFEWSYTKGTGPGGQKKNKTSSAVHCIHRPSGARGYAEDSRSQHENKKTAFLRLTETKEFQRWLKIEIMKRKGILEEVNALVERELQNIKVEVQKEGKWVEVDKNDPLDS